MDKFYLFISLFDTYLIFFSFFFDIIKGKTNERGNPIFPSTATEVSD